MAGGRHSDDDGSDTFWPGYVDAVTNLVLNLLFLLTIMIVAVFMFALELGRATKGGAQQPTKTVGRENVTSSAAVKTAESTDPLKENAALKREIERLSKELADKTAAAEKSVAGGVPKNLDASVPVARPKNGLDKAVASSFEVIVRFADDAVALSPEERERLLDALKPVVAKNRADVTVEVPAGFSEAKRMAFYRAMEVRNLLMEMKLPKDRIDLRVVEGKSNANAALVKVH